MANTNKKPLSILVVSRTAWVPNTAFGNTISNWFGGNEWKNDTFAHFYTRSTMPNNDICNIYYTVTISDIIKHILLPEKIGKKFYLEGNNNISKVDSESKSIGWLHKHPFNLIYYIMELLYRTKLWENKKFKEFISEVNPDIVFSFAIDEGISANVLKYLRKQTNAKIVLYAADDTYGSYRQKSWLRRRYLEKNLEWMIKNADLVFGATDDLGKYYQHIYGREVFTLYKGCLLNNSINEARQQPIKIVYAGNLLYGRDTVIQKFAQAIDLLNERGKTIELEIYTGTHITEKLANEISIKNTSKIMGAKPYSEITEILHRADYVLHVESFEKENIEYVHYSFSTKIIDCLQSGTGIIAVGPKEVSSINYIMRIPGTVVITNIEDIADMLKREIIDKDDYIQDRKEIREYAKKYHDINNVRKRLHERFDLITKT